MTDQLVSILTTTKHDTPTCAHFFVNGRSKPCLYCRISPGVNPPIKTDQEKRNTLIETRSNAKTRAITIKYVFAFLLDQPYMTKGTPLDESRNRYHHRR